MTFELIADATSPRDETSAQQEDFKRLKLSLNLKVSKKLNMFKGFFSEFSMF